MDSKAGVTVIYILIILLTTITSYLVKRNKCKYATEGSVALLLGLLAGGLIYFFFYVSP